MPKSENKASSELAPATGGGAACQPMAGGAPGAESVSRVCLQPCDPNSPVPTSRSEIPISRSCAASPVVFPARLKPAGAVVPGSVCQGWHHSRWASTCPFISEIRWEIRSAPRAAPEGLGGHPKSSSPPAAPATAQGSREEKRNEERVLLQGLREGMGDKAVSRAGRESCWDSVTGDCTRSPIKRKEREWDSSNHRRADGLKTGTRSSEKQQYSQQRALGNGTRLLQMGRAK